MLKNFFETQVVKKPNEKRFLEVKTTNGSTSVWNRNYEVDVNIPDPVKELPMGKKLVVNTTLFGIFTSLFFTLIYYNVDIIFIIMMYAIAVPVSKVYFDDAINKINLKKKRNKRFLEIKMINKNLPVAQREIVIDIRMFNGLARKLKNMFNNIMTKYEYYKYNKENDLSKDATIEMLYTKSAKNRGEVLKARYNAWLNADISRSRKWI